MVRILRKIRFRILYLFSKAGFTTYPKYFSTYDDHGSYMAYWDKNGDLHTDTIREGYHNSKL